MLICRREIKVSYKDQCIINTDNILKFMSNNTLIHSNIKINSRKLDLLNLKLIY